MLGPLLAGLFLFLSAQEAVAQDARIRTFQIPVFAHYVSWHTVPGAWSIAATLPLRRDNPAGGYFSVNPEIIVQHNAEMTANGMLPMISWWARDSYAGDPFLDVYLSLPGPQIGILYEASSPGRFRPVADGSFSFDDPYNVQMFVSDMEHLQKKYFDIYPERFYRIDGRPVVFIWIAHAFKGDFSGAAELARQKAGLYLIGSHFTVPFNESYARENRNIIAAMDGLSSYSFYDDKRYGVQMGDDFLSDIPSAIVSWQAWLSRNAPGVRIMLPMNFAYDETRLPERRGIRFSSTPEVAARYARLVRSHIGNPCGTSLLPVAYLTSYNEHYEGTAVEPFEVDPRSGRTPNEYLDIIRQTFLPPVVIDADRQDCRSDDEKKDGSSGD